MKRGQIDLDAAKAAFFAKGGVVTPIEGYSYKPPAPHRDFSLKPTFLSIEARARQLVEKGVTVKRIAARLGISQAEVLAMAGRNS
ncbi:hypothetical protein [Pseudomonas sp. B26(2017)]|uniref:hypothetical protein n=1 Tax=Pseudomonas sp. B26(2017) TaxID=1981732 RepID=UPI000A1EDB73|nr:hypothetical protein [Pseudomonas sp. B26(2017)]